ncbi:hypothetical protein CCP2SC5_180016 [Azospirillaceae bacterium]
MFRSESGIPFLCRLKDFLETHPRSAGFDFDRLTRRKLLEPLETEMLFPGSSLIEKIVMLASRHSIVYFLTSFLSATEVFGCDFQLEKKREERRNNRFGLRNSLLKDNDLLRRAVQSGCDILRIFLIIVR